MRQPWVARLRLRANEQALGRKTSRMNALPKPATSSTAAAMAAELEAAIEAGQLVAAIVDPASYDPAWGQFGAQTIARGGFSLFSNTPQAQDNAVAPLVLPLTSVQDALQNELVDVALKSPAVIWLASTVPIDGLAELLTDKLHAELADGRQPITLRFYDPRVLPALLTTLDKDQQQHLNAGIRTWWWLNRQGVFSSSVNSEDRASDTQAVHFGSPIALSDTQVHQLLNESFVDRVLDVLTRANAELVKPFDHTRRFSLAKDLIAAASAWGLHSEFDCASYMAVALQQGPEFALQPSWSSLMQQVKDGVTEFGAAIAQWESQNGAAA
jgi:Domain of unknown function (DUF4123)